MNEVFVVVADGTDKQIDDFVSACIHKDRQAEITGETWCATSSDNRLRKGKYLLDLSNMHSMVD